jgi:hypothetical protein
MNIFTKRGIILTALVALLATLSFATTAQAAPNPNVVYTVSNYSNATFKCTSKFSMTSQGYTCKGVLRESFPCRSGNGRYVITTSGSHFLLRGRIAIKRHTGPISVTSC